VPVAVTDRTRVVFLGMVALCGCVVIAVAAWFVTLTGALAREQPLAFVTVTVNVPAVAFVTSMNVAVEPLDQRYDAYPAGALRRTVDAGQRAVGPLAEIAGTGGSGLTVTFVAALAREQPFAFVIVTL